ncbi:MAG: DUF6290 family protein [Promethearchaeota archaeon]
MSQINFRVRDDEKKLLQTIAELRGVSVSELARQAVLKEFAPLRVDLAFQLVSGGKIGFKRAWTLSGLTYHEFLVEWAKRGAEEVIPDEVAEKSLRDAFEIDLNAMRRIIRRDVHVERVVHVDRLGPPTRD